MNKGKGGGSDEGQGRKEMIREGIKKGEIRESKSKRNGKGEPTHD